MKLCNIYSSVKLKLSRLMLYPLVPGPTYVKFASIAKINNDSEFDWTTLDLGLIKTFMNAVLMLLHFFSNVVFNEETQKHEKV